jgi:hypothetical protein
MNEPGTAADTKPGTPAGAPGAPAGTVARIAAAGGPAAAAGAPGGHLSAAIAGRRLPPVAEVAVGSMALVIVGGIYMAAHLPARPPLGVAEVLACLAGAAALANVAQLLRIRDFAWSSFFLVGKWAFLAYLVIAGMLEYVFVLDGTRGGSLVLMTCMLAIFALDVPMLLAFSVARYQEPSRPAHEAA